MNSYFLFILFTNSILEQIDAFVKAAQARKAPKQDKEKQPVDLIESDKAEENDEAKWDS